MQISLIGLNARFTHSCLSLFYLRNELLSQSDCFDVEIQQFTINDSYYELLMRITSKGSDYYFFSTYIWNSDLVIKLINDLLQIQKDCYCVVGGPQAEVVAQSCSHERCCVVIGEIERVSTDFFSDLKRKKVKTRYIGDNRKKGFSSPYLDADFEAHLKNRHIYYETSRGCPFGCTYCLSAAEKGVYHKDLEIVKKELTQILQWKPSVLRFVDRTFNDDTDRTLTLWKFLATHQCETVFHFEISPDCFSEDMFLLLEKIPAGKFQFEAGIQSTNKKTLRAIRRPVNTDAAHRTISRLSRIGNIHLHVDLILGLPYETVESFLQSFRDVFSMGPHYIQMGLLKILPDTPICHAAAEDEYCYSASAPYSVFSNKWLNSKDMQKMYWLCECVEKFLNNRYFVSFWLYIRREGFDIVEFFLGLLGRCQEEQFFKKAPTQELLCNMLLACVEKWQDYNYILDLLRYDWLRCSHRYLPEKLKVPEEMSSKSLKKKLFKMSDDAVFIEGTSSERTYCLKKGFFLKFSNRFIEEQGFLVKDGKHFLCFLPEREPGFYQFNRVAQFIVKENT